MSGNDILTSIKSRNSVKISRKLTGTCNNPKLDLMNDVVHTKFRQNMSIRCIDNERK